MRVVEATGQMEVSNLRRRGGSTRKWYIRIALLTLRKQGVDGKIVTSALRET